MEELENEIGVLADTDEYVDVCVGLIETETLDGFPIEEADFHTKGEIWRVHKTDADPFPSNPHAHCIEGKGFVGCKMHLGTAKLYKDRRSLERRMSRKKFKLLIELIKPKFPNIELPLPHRPA